MTSGGPAFICMQIFQSDLVCQPGTRMSMAFPFVRNTTSLRSRVRPCRFPCFHSKVTNYAFPQGKTYKAGCFSCQEKNRFPKITQVLCRKCAASLPSRDQGAEKAMIRYDSLALRTKMVIIKKRCSGCSLTPQPIQPCFFNEHSGMKRMLLCGAIKCGALFYGRR